MSFRSKNFIFRRRNKGTEFYDYKYSDKYYPTNPDYKWNENSEKMPASGYYGSTHGLHTISITLRNFNGRISLQATLATDPTEADWFNIKFGNCGSEFLEFNNDLVYKDTNDVSRETYGTSGTFMENVVGNFTFLRVCINRDYIDVEPSEYKKMAVGNIEEILINY